MRTLLCCSPHRMLGWGVCACLGCAGGEPHEPPPPVAPLRGGAHATDSDGPTVAAPSEDAHTDASDNPIPQHFIDAAKELEGFAAGCEEPSEEAPHADEPPLKGAPPESESTDAPHKLNAVGTAATSTPSRNKTQWDAAAPPASLPLPALSSAAPADIDVVSATPPPSDSSPPPKHLAPPTSPDLAPIVFKTCLNHLAAYADSESEEDTAAEGHHPPASFSEAKKPMSAQPEEGEQCHIQ